MQSTLAIVGGGASGFAAGIAALRAGAHGVLLLEQQDRAGKKILATGNGRCNLTNTQLSAACYASAQPAAVEQVLGAVPPARVLGFFARAGLLWAEKEAGRVYPQSNQAATVLEVLRAEFARLGGVLRCGACVEEITPAHGGFALRLAQGEVLHARRVAVCTGGMAAPQLGCGGAGYTLLRALGHTVRAPYPCLAPLKCDSPYPKMLKGVKVQCTARLWAKKTLLAQEDGDLLFTEYGVSGIPALQLCGCVHTAQPHAVQLELDVLPALDEAALRTYLHARARAQAAEPAQTLLAGTVHTKLGQILLKAAKIDPTQPCGSLAPPALAALASLMKHWLLPVSGTLGWGAAQVTGGGIPLEEIDARTMESRLCAGLYLCGELLDAAGLCGGYNLHWAWATGILAGEAAAGAAPTGEARHPTANSATPPPPAGQSRPRQPTQATNSKKGARTAQATPAGKASIHTPRAAKQRTPHKANTKQRKR